MAVYTGHPVDVVDSSPRPWLARFTQKLGRKPAAPAPAAAADPLLAFDSEAASPVEAASTAPTAVASRPAVRLGKGAMWGLVAVAVAVPLAVGGAMWWLRVQRLNAAAAAAAPGTLTIDTRPAGAEILVDGQRRGAAPLTLPLAPGKHWLTVRSGGEERMVPMTVASGAQLTQYLELAPAASPAASTGKISIVTDPPGARVSVDGRAHGASPLTIPDLAAAAHKVIVSGDTGSIERTVSVEAGATTAVVFALPKVSAPFGGWVTVKAPFEVQVAEGSDIIGLSGTTRIMLAAGRHDLLLSNKTLGYSETRTIDVAAGRTGTLAITPPTAPMSANARPWADVSVDGSSVGQTPISNLQLAIGTHRVTFRHPQYGERAQTITVTTTGPNRVAVDLTKP